MVIKKYKCHMDHLETSIKVALVSDLHDRSPIETIAALKKVHPDLILVAGDLMERHEIGASEWTVEKMDAFQGIPLSRTKFTKVIKLLDGSLPGVKHHVWKKENGYIFLREASKIAPVFLGMGNHEWYYTRQDHRILNKYHVQLLDNEDATVTIKGTSFQIGALSTRYDLDWLHSFGEKDGYKILICHHPDYYLKFIHGREWDSFNLVVSGHTHGGQWRLFSAGGEKRGVSVFAPGQGFFPQYAYGRFGKMIVSSGVSNTSSMIPRFGNPCELVLIQLCS